MVATVVVGFTTRTADGLLNNLPEFHAPDNWVDAEKIRREVAKQKAAFVDRARHLPYAGTFEEVVLVDPRDGTPLRWAYHPPSAGRPPVSVRVRDHLVERYPDAWADDGHGRRPPKVVFVGFAPRAFLRLLGLECSLPAVGRPCPPGLWYATAACRDVGEAVLPVQDYNLTMPYVVRLRRPAGGPAAESWDGYTRGWAGPGASAEADAMIALELGRQVGIVAG